MQRYLIILVTLLLLAVSAHENEETCRTYADGHVYPEATGSAPDRTWQWTKATSKLECNFIQKRWQQPIFTVSRPAPMFEGTAVINGEFSQLSLADYLGKYVVFFFYPLDL